MRCSSKVIVGNEYLARYAEFSGAKSVGLIPTVIDADRYSVPGENRRKRIVIGWIGSPSTEGYLLNLIPVFERLKNSYNVSFVAIGASDNSFKNTPVEVLPWDEETEVDLIKDFDIGVMPLTDSHWERGKCGYKLIQYMACSIPVVGSLVGVNEVIIKQDENGYLVSNLIEWEERLRTLIDSEELRLEMGKNGREGVSSWYTLQKQAPRLYEALLL